MSNPACWSGVSKSAERNRISEGLEKPRSASIEAKSLSAETMTCLCLIALLRIFSSLALKVRGLERGKLHNRLFVVVGRPWEIDWHLSVTLCRVGQWEFAFGNSGHGEF